MLNNYSGYKIKLLHIMFLSVLAVSPLSLHAAVDDEDEIQSTASLYIWGAGLKGSTGNAAGGAPVDASFSDILDNLESGIMWNYRGKGDKWALGIDYIYLNISPSSDVPPATVDLRETVTELSVGYEVQPGLEVLAGFRYIDIRTSARLNVQPSPPPITGADNWFDPIVGLDYRRALSGKWKFYGRGDIGGFGVGSDLTWQLAGYFGYMPSKNWNLFAGYRHIDVDYESDNEKKFFYDIAISGPLIGFGYNF